MSNQEDKLNINLFKNTQNSNQSVIFKNSNLIKMSIRIFLIFSLVSLYLYCVPQNDLGVKLEKFLQQPDYVNASVGIQIQDLNSGETIFGFNSEKLLIPASTLKIVTSASALEILGPNYHFETQIGYVGEIDTNKELKGDLIVIGGGDPTLGSEYFRNHEFNYDFLNNWVQKIKVAGISHIQGDLIFDSSLYDSEKIPHTWIWGDIGNYYGAGANALTVYDNLFKITFKSNKRAGELTEIISIYPKIEGMEIKNEVVSSDVNADQAYVFGSPTDKTRVIRGTISKGRDAFTIKAAIPQPEEIMSRDLINCMAKEGIFISGRIIFDKVDKSKLNSIYIQQSPKLAEIVEILNHESINLFAEHLVYQIAAQKTGIGNRENGIEIIKQFWLSKGIQSEKFFMEDGSGLSHFNAISPSQLVSVLDFMYNHSENKEAFLNSLPNAGNGTLSGFSTKFFPGVTLNAKSGSMTRVRCYAGYLQLDSGHAVAFSIMFNHFSGSNQKLVKEIENFLYELRTI